MKVSGGNLSKFSAHLDYFGMHFMGIWRLEGMKDPVKNHLGYFLLGKDGVKFRFYKMSKNIARKTRKLKKSYNYKKSKRKNRNIK
jgi:hypothetical protein